MKKLLLLTLVIMINIGCFTLSKRIKGPDGSQQLQITCKDISHCYERARKECGSDFTVIDRFYASNRGESYIDLVVKCNVNQPDDAYGYNVQADVRSIESEIKKCFDEFAKNNNITAKNEITLEWTIDMDGRAKNLTAIKNTFSSDEVEVCIGTIIRNKIFSKPKERPQSVRKRFVLTTENTND